MILPPEPPADAPRNFPPSHLTPADGAAATIGVATEPVEAVDGGGARKGRILAWGLWDWGSATFNAVVTTFVFTVYLTSESFGPTGTVEAQLGLALAIAGLLIAVLAPITASARHERAAKALAGGEHLHRRRAHACDVLRAARARYLMLGLFLVAAGNVFFEFAGVNYNAMLVQVSTPRSIGKVSGFGWGMGYVGGIVLLLIVYFGFIQPEVGLFGVTGEDGLDVRVTMLVRRPGSACSRCRCCSRCPSTAVPPASIAARSASSRPTPGSARHRPALGEQRDTVWFLLASAVFRDGLAGVFTFGGVLAASVFGYSAGEVIIFAIAANVVAGVSTIAVGALDDRLGAKLVIITALIGLVVSGLSSSSCTTAGRSCSGRRVSRSACSSAPPSRRAARSSHGSSGGARGRGVRALRDDGRAVSFLAPTVFALFVTIGGRRTSASSASCSSSRSGSCCSSR